MSEEKNERNRDLDSDTPSDADGSKEATEHTTQQPEDERDIMVRDLTARLEAARREAELTRDQLLRKAAEFENYRRRNESEHAIRMQNANERLISAILPIINDFVRSLAQRKEGAADDPFSKGVELIYTKLMRVLEQQGVTTFDSVGQPFNVEFHDALFMVPRSDVPPHTVVEEIEKGYKLHSKVLRHAKVIVSSPPDAPPEAVEGRDQETRSEGD